MECRGRCQESGKRWNTPSERYRPREVELMWNDGNASRGGLAGLQATSTTPQQVAQGRFTAQALQNNLQQVGQ